MRVPTHLNWLPAYLGHINTTQGRKKGTVTSMPLEGEVMPFLVGYRG